MLLALALVGVAILPSASSARSRSQARYLGAANKGVKQTHKWWNRGRHWYSSVLDGSSVASLWGIVPLFEAFDGLQVAQPSKRHRDQLNRLARGAELYLNPNLRPVSGLRAEAGPARAGEDHVVRRQRQLVRHRAAQRAERAAPGARLPWSLSAHLVREEGVAGERAEGQHPAALGQRSDLRLDGGARSLAPAPGYGVVPAASNAISAIVIPRMSPTA
jgi:hypothetical protein